MTNNPWTVEQEKNGNGENKWRVHYKGEPWPHDPHATKESARDYMKRLQRRYRGDSPSLFMNGEGDENTRQRGGPWRWTTPEDATTAEEHGRTGVIQTKRLKDAKDILRHKMQRKRLPNGIEWEIEN